MKTISRPPVTVLMPIYNSQKYLKSAIQSILNQSFQNFEFLIIEDGSTDSSLQIIKEFSDSRIRLIFHKKNLGIVRTLNEGFRHAKGKYIVRMDADDVSLKSRITLQYEFMEKNPDIDACASWIEVFGDEKSYIWKTPVAHEDIMARSLFETPIAHPSVILRKDTFRKHKFEFRQSHLFAEDYDVWTRLGRVGKLHTLPKVLLKYRAHSGQTASTKSRQQQANSLKVRIRLLKELGLKPTKAQIKLHNDVANWRKVDINSLKIWLNLLAKANQSAKIYDSKALNTILIEKWLGSLALHQPSLLKKIVYAFSAGPYLKLPSFRYVLNKIKG